MVNPLYFSDVFFVDPVEKVFPFVFLQEIRPPAGMNASAAGYDTRELRAPAARRAPLLRGRGPRAGAAGGPHGRGRADPCQEFRYDRIDRYQLKRASHKKNGPDKCIEEFHGGED